MMKKMMIMWRQTTTTDRLRREAVLHPRFLLAFAAPVLFIGGIKGQPEDVQILDFDNGGISSDHKTNEKSQRLWDLVNQCTHRITVNASGALEIGIGIHRADGSFDANEFRWEQLESYYRRQPDKGMAAIIIAPSPDDKGKAQAEELSGRFLSLGFSRVVVVQNTGSGYVLLDDRKSGANEEGVGP